MIQKLMFLSFLFGFHCLDCHSFSSEGCFISAWSHAWYTDEIRYSYYRGVATVRCKIMCGGGYFQGLALADIHSGVNCTISQSVIYEDMPLYCTSCCRLGHKSTTCGKSDTQELPVDEPIGDPSQKPRNRYKDGRQKGRSCMFRICLPPRTFLQRLYPYLRL